MKAKLVTVREASESLGITPDQIRYRMRNDQFSPKIGYCYASRNGRNFTYEIYEDMLNAYLGVEPPKEDKDEHSIEYQVGKAVIEFLERLTECAKENGGLRNGNMENQRHLQG